MKKTALILSFLLAFGVFNNGVISAKESESYDVDQVQEEINRIEDDYVKSLGLETSDDLSKSQLITLIDMVNDYKTELYGVATHDEKTETYGYPGYWSYYTGDLFLTLDASTEIIGDITWNHGHAGIGGWDKGSVIEANPDEGVEYYYNRYWYWNGRNDGGIYKVKNAVNDDYFTATTYAQDQVGGAYGFNALDPNDFYCSELVYYAWAEAGYDLDNNRWDGTFILPKHLMLDAETELLVSFPAEITE